MSSYFGPYKIWYCTKLGTSEVCEHYVKEFVTEKVEQFSKKRLVKLQTARSQIVIKFFLTLATNFLYDLISISFSYFSIYEVDRASEWLVYLSFSIDVP